MAKNFKVISSGEEIEKSIIGLLRKKVKQDGPPEKIKKAVSEICDKIQAVIRDAILDSDTFTSLLIGKLKADFGLDSERISQLPDILPKLVAVESEVVFSQDSKSVFSIFINIYARDPEDPVTKSITDAASFTTEKANGYIVDWLNWLLFAGDTTVNESYRVYYKAGKGRSRMAIMVKQDGASFSVDGQFAGIEGNNFITQAIQRSKEEIVAILRSYNIVPK